MKTLVLVVGLMLAATGANAGDKLPAVYLGQWCESRDVGFHFAIKRGEDCHIEPTIIKPNKMTSTELECRFRSIRKMSERTVEIVAYCRAEDERSGYIQKLWLTTYSKGMLYEEVELRQ
jgi:hypothetical protein